MWSTWQQGMIDVRTVERSVHAKTHALIWWGTRVRTSSVSIHTVRLRLHCRNSVTADEGIRMPCRTITSRYHRHKVGGGGAHVPMMYTRQSLHLRYVELHVHTVVYVYTAGAGDGPLVQRTNNTHTRPAGQNIRSTTDNQQQHATLLFCYIRCVRTRYQC